MERENARFERADIEGLRLSPEHRDALEGGPVRVYATGIRWYPEDAGLVEEWMSEAMRSSDLAVRVRRAVPRRREGRQVGSTLRVPIASLAIP